MPRRLEGKTLLVSGARGIAAATARLASAEGARLCFVSRTASDCLELEREIRDAGGAAAFVVGDLSGQNTVDAVMALCLERFGRIDALYNVAGVSVRRLGDGPVHECSDQAWDEAMRLNLRSVFLLSRAVLKTMLEQDPLPGAPQRGVVLNMSSVQAVAPAAELFAAHAYAASKAAVAGLSQAMAAYYAPRGIRVNAIAPAVVRTPLTERAQTQPELQQYLRRRQPLGDPFIDAESVASASIFLLSDESRHVSGETLSVDAGWRLATG